MNIRNLSRYRLLLTAAVATLISIPAFSGKNSTKIRGTKTAAVTITKTETYDWTLVKTTPPRQEPYVIPQGESGSVAFTITATRTGPAVTHLTSPVTGQICITNSGLSKTNSLQITDRLEVFNGGTWQAITAPINIPVGVELNPGQTQCYPYSFSDITLDPRRQYRNHAVAAINNFYGHDGTSYGIDIFAPITITRNTTQVNPTATVGDIFACPAGFTCTPPGFNQVVTGTTSIPFTVQLENNSVSCGNRVTATNNATLDPSTSHVIFNASATVTIGTGTCPTTTAIRGAKTASATVSRTETYRWALEKTTPPRQNPYLIPQGQSGSVSFTITATRTGPTVTNQTSPVSGQVCVTNTGSVATSGLDIDDRLEVFNSGVWQSLTSTIDIPVGGELNPGQTQCYPYSFSDVDLDPQKQYRNHAIASISNGQSGTLNIDIFAPISIITTTTEVVDPTAALNDTFVCPTGFTCTPPGFNQVVSGTTSVPFTVELTNDSVACGNSVTATNNATLDPSTTHVILSASATVTIGTGTCPTTTTIEGTKTASATVSRTETFRWALEKTTPPRQDPYLIPQGQSGSVSFTITATRTGPTVTQQTSPVSGQICVTNTGTVTTSGLGIQDRLEVFTSGVWQALTSATTIPVGSELTAGQTQCYPYSFSGVELDPQLQYRNHAIASISNGQSGNLSIDIFAPIAITTNTNQVDPEATLNDTFACPTGFTCTPLGFNQVVSGTTSIPFSVQLTNNSVACANTRTATNSATLDPSTSHVILTASATVTISTGTCPSACPVLTPDQRCTAPTEFDFVSTRNGDWTTGSTWAGGVAPSVENINNQQIRITHNVTVQNNNLKLDNGTIIYVTQGGMLTLRNGNIHLEDGNQSSTEKLLVSSGTVRTTGNVQQNGTATVVCTNNAKLEIGDESAASNAVPVFTTGIFAAGGSTTSANFQNTSGYRRLENTCLNVTSNLQNDGGTDEYVGVCGDIGDRGANSGPINNSGGGASRDGDDSGNWDNKSTTGTITTMCNSEFYIPNGNVTNAKTFRIYDTQFRLTDGGATFDNQSGGTITGEKIVVWINKPDSGNIINQGTWAASTIQAWRTDNSNAPSGLAGIVAESTAASILTHFNNCTCAVTKRIRAGLRYLGIVSDFGINTCAR